MAKKNSSKAARFSDRAARLEALGKVAGGFERWRPATEVLTKVRSVPTVFPQVDVATRVGGWPIERMTLLHGPSNEGKTAFAIGLGMSFLRGDHFYGHVDAERTTDEEWLRKLMGDDVEHPGFVARRPDTFEETVEAVREFAKAIASARDSGDLPEDTSGILVVDSLRKLVPQDMLKRLEEEAVKKGVDGLGGRAAMLKAAMNAAWFDELIPLLHRTGTGLVIISRESENANKEPWEPDWKLTGGRAQFYDSSLVARVTRGWAKDTKDGPVVGERHRVRIYKTKVGGKEGRYTDAFFHTSNGTVSSFGFDRARDVFEMAEECGAVRSAGGRYSTEDGEQLGHGKAAALRSVREDPKTLSYLEEEARRRFEPEEGIVDGSGD